MSSKSYISYFSLGSILFGPKCLEISVVPEEEKAALEVFGINKKTPHFGGFGGP